MSTMPWLRNEAFVHGSLRFSNWFFGSIKSDLQHEAAKLTLAGKEAAAAGAGEFGDTDAHDAGATGAGRAESYDDVAFDRLGQCLARALALDIGSALQAHDVRRSATALAKAWDMNNINDDNIPQSEIAVVDPPDECIAVVELFLALLSNDNFNDGGQSDSGQIEGEFALLLLVQMWRELKQFHPAKESMTIWPNPEITETSGASHGESPSPPGNMQTLSLDAQHMYEFAAPASPSALPWSPRSLALNAIAKENEEQRTFVSQHAKEICWLLSLCEAQGDARVEYMGMTRKTAQSSRQQFMSKFSTCSLTPTLARSLRFLVQGDTAIFVDSSRRVRCLEVYELLCILRCNDAVNPVLVCSNSTVASDNENTMSSSGETEERTLVISGAHRKTTLHGDVDLVRLTHEAETTLEKNNENNSDQRQKRAQVDEQAVVVDKIIVFDCSDSTIYALRPSKHVRVVGCSRCVIVLGPCAGIVSLEHCNDVMVIAIAGWLSVSNCYDSRLFVHTLRSRPILTGDCVGLILGPYNTFYPRLNLHLAAIQFDQCSMPGASLAWSTFLWRKPVDATIKVGDLDGYDKSKVFSLLPPEDFTVFITPFLEKRDPPLCTENPAKLPAEYAAAMQRKINAVQTIVHKVAVARSNSAADNDAPTAETAVNTPNKACLERAIQAAFKDWLCASGNVRQIVDLVKLSTARH